MDRQSIANPWGDLGRSNLPRQICTRARPPVSGVQGRSAVSGDGPLYQGALYPLAPCIRGPVSPGPLYQGALYPLAPCIRGPVSPGPLCQGALYPLALYQGALYPLALYQGGLSWM
jgi:hypothetical protein